MLRIYHHNDADGRCAAAIVGRSRFARDKFGVSGPVEYEEVDYGMVNAAFAEDVLCDLCRLYDEEGDPINVFVVDFSFPESLVASIEAEDICDLHWIDHHASAKHCGHQHLKGSRDFTDKGRSACELAWEYCFPNASVKSEFGTTPIIVKLIGDYDSGRWEYKDRCKPLILALDACQCTPSNGLWNALFSLEAPYELEFAIPHNLIEQGKVMAAYQEGYAAGMCKTFGFETEFKGLRCYAVNIYKMGPMAFGWEMHEYDACIAFAFDGAQFTVSMYSEKPNIDCSAICKKYGGGGHKGAAGFVAKTLPFKKQ